MYLNGQKWIYYSVTIGHHRCHNGNYAYNNTYCGCFCSKSYLINDEDDKCDSNAVGQDSYDADNNNK